MELVNSNKESAITRFFNIQELAFLLAAFLDHKGISRLMQTKRHWNKLFAPAHFYHVYAYFESRKNNIFGATESIVALSRNSHYVRELDLGPFDLVYYINCVFAYQDLLSQTTGIPSSRPSWLAPPDPHLCPVFPIPPMTLLTTLNIDVEPRIGKRLANPSPYYLPSSRHPRMKATQVCWILQLNPHLIHVTIVGFVFRDARDTHLFTTAIYGLTKLQDFYISGEYEPQSVHRLALTILLACPPLLQTLRMELSDLRLENWTDIWASNYILLEPGRLHAWEKEDEECDLTSIPRRQEPLQRLTHLTLEGWEMVFSAVDVREVLQHCPSLCTLTLPYIGEINQVDLLASAIAGSCPKLRRLRHQFNGRYCPYGPLILRTIDLLSPQQLELIHCDALSFEIPDLDAVSLFWRHSNTLQSITLGGCQSVTSKAIQVLLVECRSLEVLYTGRAATHNKMCIDLEDAIEFPWGCTRLRELDLTIGVPDEPLHLHTGVEPYYNRPAYSTLTAAEKEQFKLLEVLYQQFGSLVLIEKLILNVLFYDPEGNRPLRKYTRNNTFPGMLSLGNKTGQPGFLHHLGGLTKLRQLLGSVNARTFETVRTIGQPEVEWMNEHWPALERAQFCDSQFRVPSELVWLQKQRSEHNRLSIY